MDTYRIKESERKEISQSSDWTANHLIFRKIWKRNETEKIMCIGEKWFI